MEEFDEMEAARNVAKTLWDCIEEIASPELQCRLWLHGGAQISSYVELSCFFSESVNPELLVPHLDELGINSEEWQSVLDLDAKMAGFHESCEDVYDNQAMIDSPSWRVVVRTAQEVLALRAKRTRGARFNGAS